MTRKELIQELRKFEKQGTELSALAKEAADTLDRDAKEHYELLNLRKKLKAQREEIKRLHDLRRK